MRKPPQVQQCFELIKKGKTRVHKDVGLCKSEKISERTRPCSNNILCKTAACDFPLTKRKRPVPEFIDPVFTKTSPKRSFSVIQNERFGLVFAKTGCFRAQAPEAADRYGTARGTVKAKTRKMFTNYHNLRVCISSRCLGRVMMGWVCYCVCVQVRMEHFTVL
jgi:hypothetical protein